MWSTWVAIGERQTHLHITSTCDGQWSPPLLSAKQTFISAVFYVTRSQKSSGSWSKTHKICSSATTSPDLFYKPQTRKQIQHWAGETWCLPKLTSHILKQDMFDDVHFYKYKWAQNQGTNSSSVANRAVNLTHHTRALWRAGVLQSLCLKASASGVFKEPCITQTSLRGKVLTMLERHMIHIDSCSFIFHICKYVLMMFGLKQMFFCYLSFVIEDHIYYYRGDAFSHSPVVPLHSPSNISSLIYWLYTIWLFKHLKTSKHF